MKRFHHLAVWLVCLGVILAPLDAGAGMRAPAADSPAEVRLLQSDQQVVVLELATPSYQIQTDKIGSTDIQRVTAPGLSLSDQPGKPELPTIGKLVAVPAGVQVHLTIVQDQSQPLSGKYLLPLGPETARLQAEGQPGAFQESLPATKASSDLRSQGPYPSAPVQLGQEAWLRDQRLVQVVFSPFQYDLASGEITWHRLLRVELTFSDQTALRNLVTPADPLFEPVYRQTVFNYESGVSLRSQGPSPLAPPANSREADTSTRYRIVVDHPGLYRLSYTDLQAAGMPVDQIDPRNLQLTNQDRDVAILVNGEKDGSFDPGDAILFYGEAFQGDVMASMYAGEDDNWRSYNGWQAQLTPAYFERYTTDNVYWLWLQAMPGLRMPAAISGVPNGTGTVPEVYTDTVRAEQSHRYWSFHFTNQDPWVWDDMQVTSVATHTYTTTLTALGGNNYNAIVRGEILSGIYSSTGSPDHHTWFTLNDGSQVYADATWDGATRQPFSFEVPQSLLRNGANELHMSAMKTAAIVGGDKITFDWFSIEYARLFQAEDDQLIFERDEAGGKWEYRISNFSSPDLQIFDITNPLIPQPIDNSLSSFYHPVYLPVVTQNSVGSSSIQSKTTIPPGKTGAVELAFQASHLGTVRYLTLAAPAIRTPKSVSAYTPPDLYAASNRADYVIIAPAAFIPTSQALADYRAAQGLHTMVVDIQDIYNQFNYGIAHPLAIKRFLSYAYQSWQSPGPAYVVLVGDGTWNFKGYTGNTDSGSLPYTDTTIYMQPYMAWVDPWQGEVDSSSLLATVVGADVLPDLSIARIPVNTASQLQTVIDKTITYESTPGQPWQQRLLFAADNPDAAGDFNALTESVISESTPPDFAIDRVLLSTYAGSDSSKGIQAAYDITTTLNLTGTLFMNYIGHAAINRWASEGMLITTGDPALANSSKYNYIVTLDNGNRLPIMISMDCLDGYWNYAVEAWSSLAEEMLRAPAKGAVAAYSPTGLGVASGHDVLNRSFYSAIFDGGVQELGPATIISKAALFDTGLHYDLIDTFTIFGDPALRIPTTVAPARSEQTAAWGGTAVYDLRLTNTDVYTGTPSADTFTLTAQGNAWPVAFSSNDLSLLPGESTNVQVTVSLPAASPPPAPADDVEVMVASNRLGGGIAAATLVTTGSPAP